MTSCADDVQRNRKHMFECQNMELVVGTYDELILGFRVVEVGAVCVMIMYYSKRTL